MSDCASIRDHFFGPGQLERGNPQLEAHLEGCAACRRAALGLPVVERALAELPRLAVPVPPFERIAQAAGGVARSRRRRLFALRSLPFVWTGSAAAAAALCFAFFAGNWGASAPPLAKPGTLLDAASGRRLARLDCGARVSLEGGQVRVLAGGEAEEGLRLERGSVSLEVPRLPQGRALSVRTPDAEVRVHGTRFQVLRDAGGTSVSVAEGLVEVRPTGRGRAPLFLRAGGSTVVEPLEEYRRRARSAALAALDQGQMATAERHLAELLATEPEASMAAEAEVLLAWSSAASGDHRGAIERYRQALSTLPADEKSPWADNACAELALLVEQEEPAAAADAWRLYVRRFPHGLHAALARARAVGAKEP